MYGEFEFLFLFHTFHLNADQHGIKKSSLKVTQKVTEILRGWVGIIEGKEEMFLHGKFPATH